MVRSTQSLLYVKTVNFIIVDIFFSRFLGNVYKLLCLLHNLLCDRFYLKWFKWTFLAINLLTTFKVFKNQKLKSHSDTDEYHNSNERPCLLITCPKTSMYMIKMSNNVSIVLWNALTGTVSLITIIKQWLTGNHKKYCIV